MKDNVDDGRDDDRKNGNWDNIEEKEREGDDDDDNDVFDITTVQLFGMPNEEFFSKDTYNNKKEEEEEDKRKGNYDNNGKNSEGGAKGGRI